MIATKAMPSAVFASEQIATAWGATFDTAMLLQPAQ
jgi:hypothetical protein